MKKLVFPLSCLVLLVACKNDAGSAEESAMRALEAEVIRIHDEVMPKMGEINSLDKQLNAILESATLPAEDAELINTAFQRLSEADSLMWDWMHNYSVPGGAATVAEKTKYLEGEKRRIEICAEKMLSSIARGQELVTKYGAQ